MVTALSDYAYIGPSDISQARFVALVVAAGSPAVGEAAAMWAALVRRGVKPLPFLAHWNRESNVGTNTKSIEVIYNTKNPGAVRSPQNPENGGWVIDTDRGDFAAFPSYEAAARDWADRIRGEKYEGAGLMTATQIIPVYAPAKDNNNVTAYIRSVLGFISRHLQLGEVIMPTPPPIHTDYVPAGAPNRPGIRIVPRFFTVHETANTSPGATAAMHRTYVVGEHHGGPQRTSYNFVTDNAEAFALIPIGESSNHAGTPEGNTSGVSMEICVNSPDGSPGWEKAVENAIAIIAKVYRETPTLGPPEESLVPHRHWRATACPARLTGERWAEFKARAIAAIEATAGDPDDAKLEAAYQADKDCLENKRFAGILTRHFPGLGDFNGKVLVCDGGVLGIYRGEVHELISRVIDDWVIASERDGTLRRLG